jgi:HEPN domain-containing protein
MTRWQRDESLPSPDSRELALLLVRKAESDEAILDKLLDDVDIPDDALGFHAQQAIEKRLKAVLAFHGVTFDRTHSLAYLTSLLEHHGIELPAGRDEIEGLTPWAVAARYEDRFDEVLDRSAVREQLSAVRDWSGRLTR